MLKLDREKKLQSIIEVAQEISHIQDLDVLFEHLLTEARKIVNADAGSIYVVSDKSLSIKYAQNDTVAALNPGGKLPYTYFSFPINEKSMAGYVALTGKKLNIQDAYNLPDELPFAFNKETDKSTGYRTRSVYTMPLRSSQGEILGVLQIINAQDGNSRVIPFDSDAELFLYQFSANAAQVLEHAYLTDEMVRRMLMMAAFRDPKETYPHVERVARFSVEIYDRWAENHQIDKVEKSRMRDKIRIAAKFHDIGKVGVSDLILKKTFPRLTEDERAVMKGHTCIGAKLFLNGTSETDILSFQVALHHHERWDGGKEGYPGNIDLKDYVEGEAIPKATPLKGEEIPLAARIVAVADVFDALSHKRSYKDAWTIEDAVEEILNDSGKHFDPEVVEAFLQILNRIYAIHRLHPDED